jgi:carboxymethylenebutenolidase
MLSFVALPADNQPRGGVVVIPELFGISGHVRDVCERLARSGYLAVAVDTNHRTAAPGLELAETEAGRTHGFELLNQATRENALADVAAATDYLSSQGCERVGCVGLSVGGHIAYLAAATQKFDAVAIFYAGWLPTTDIPLSQPEPTLVKTSSISAPLRFFVGELDHVVPSEQRSAISAALEAADIDFKLIEYPGAQHGFMSERRAGFQLAASEAAWEELSRFFGETL